MFVIPCLQSPAISWPYLCVIAVQLCIITYTWQFRQLSGAKAQIYCLSFKSFWLLFLIWAGNASSWTEKIFWLSGMKIAALFTVYFWLVQIVELSDQEKMLPKMARYFFLTVISGLTLVFLFVDHWKWRRIFQGGQILNNIPSPVGWLAWVLSTLALGFCLRWVLTNIGLRRRQAIWYLIAGLISVIGNILNYFPAAQVMAPIALAFLLSTLCMVWGFYRYQVYNMLTLAQELAWRNLNDGLLVIDNDDCIVAVNPAAQDCLAGLPVAVGGPFSTLTAGWSALAEIAAVTDLQPREAFRECHGEHRDYQLQKTTLTNYGRQFGKVVLIKDITQFKQNQAQLLEQQKILSILTERERLGRELHDGPGQIWNYWKLELQTVQTLMREGQIEQAGAEIRRLVEVARELNANARDSIVGLKTAAVTDCDFTKRLRDYLAWYEKNHAIATQLQLPLEPPEQLFDQATALQLLRIIQEALTNIRKHARASQVQVKIAKQDERISVVIADNGCGFDPAALPPERTSFGLQIMIERVAEVGGQLRIDSQPGAGTQVIIEFLLEKAERTASKDANLVGG